MLLHFRHRPKALKKKKKTKRKQTHPIPLDIRSINFRSINHPITLQRPNKLAHPCNSREQVHTLGRWPEQRRPVPRLTKHDRSNILTQPRLQFATKLFAKYFGRASGWFSICLYPLTARFQTLLALFQPFPFSPFFTPFSPPLTVTL